MRKIKVVFYFCLIIISALSFSCSDDALNSSELFVYMRGWATSISVEKSFTEDGSITIEGKNEIKFPLYLTRESSVDVYASVGYEESQVEVYNRMHGTSFKILPSKSLSVDGDLLIQSGLLQSTDSVLIKLDYSEVESGEYLIPVAIKNVTSDDSGIRASMTSSIVFYTLSIAVNNIKMNDFNVIEGTKIDRSNWNITCAVNPSKAPVTNLIDGNLETLWEGQRSSKHPIEVDMGSLHKLKGLSFHYKYNIYSYAPQSFTVYSSVDGIEWANHGMTGNYPFSKDIKDIEYGINFFVPVDCRYIRLIINRAANSYSGPRFNELYAIE